MGDRIVQSERVVNCVECWMEGDCLVEISFNQAGNVTEARVAELPQGWEYRPYGEAGGQAPYCPRCQK
jgi:hypothetical protein